MAAPDYEAWRFSDGPTERTLAHFRDKPLNFEPRSQHEYSNSGYILLGYLIERISGQSYGTFLRERIFTPLGMKDTGTDSTPAIIANRAADYAEGQDGVVASG